MKAMGSSPLFCSKTILLLLISSSVLLHSLAEAQAGPPVAKGLSYTFYKTQCPKLEFIVRKHLRRVFRKDIGLAAALLRIHFHDCFVQGCDGSVLLDGSVGGPGEKEAPPNLTLRPAAFAAINDLRAAIDRKCGGRVVSCADVVALAARDSVYLSGGPDYRVPLGRRDGLNFASLNATLASLPPPTSNVTRLLNAFSKLNLDTDDLVALSGAHTIGVGHCSSFSNRLYPTQDPTMDEFFARELYGTCPSANSNSTTVLDIRSPTRFDNMYYVDLVNRQGLFTSDQDLFTDGRTRGLVTSFAVDQHFFFESFAVSMMKMGQLSVLTGVQGEIRDNCSLRNPDDNEGIWSVVDGDAEEATAAAAAAAF